MSAPPTEDRRATLNGWITGSRRVQRQLGWGAVGGSVASVGAWVVSSTVGIAALLTVLGVYGIGMWITASHIADWKTRLEVMDRAERKRK